MRTLIIFLMLATPAFACPITVTSTASETTVCYAFSVCKTVLHNEFSSGSKSRQEAQLEESFQAFFDKRLRLTELPTSFVGLAERGTNPNTPSKFWGFENGDRAVSDLDATHVIDRLCKVESVTKNGRIFDIVITNP